MLTKLGVACARWFFLIALALAQDQSAQVEVLQSHIQNLEQQLLQEGQKVGVPFIWSVIRKKIVVALPNCMVAHDVNGSTYTPEAFLFSLCSTEILKIGLRSV
jgi:hypothetical protein